MQMVLQTSDEFFEQFSSFVDYSSQKWGLPVPLQLWGFTLKSS
jgi:hypothetical protein